MAVTNKASLSLLALAGVEPYQEKAGEEYMNENQVAHFKKILQAVFLIKLQIWQEALSRLLRSQLNLCFHKSQRS